MVETNWGFYNYFLKNEDEKKLVVAFTGKNNSYAIYTLDFSSSAEMTFHADRAMLGVDVSSYIPPTKISLTLDNLEQKLKTMQPTQTSELEFRKFLLQKSN